MKPRVTFIIVIVAALAIAVIILRPPQAASPSEPALAESPSVNSLPDTPPPAVIPSAPPAPATVGGPAPANPAYVAIEEGKTIDFSSGTPDVRNTATDHAALASALAEMEAATDDFTFPPSPTNEP